MYLAIVAGFMGVTDDGSVPEVARCGPCCLPMGVFTASKGSNFHILFSMSRNADYKLKMLKMSHFMRKQTICIGENKDVDRCIREADQRLCFRFSESTSHFPLKSEI